LRRGAHGETQPSPQRWEENLRDQRALAGAGNAGDGAEYAERELHVDVLEVVLSRGANLDEVRAHPLAALLGPRNAILAAEELPGDRVLVRQRLGGRALGDDVSAALTRAGTEFDQMIRRPDHVLVVLDHQHGVADVHQVADRSDQAPGVALVQADGRLVQHVADADQPRADLRRQADALRLATRKRRAGPVQREISDADVLHEVQPLADLVQDRGGDRRGVAFEAQPIEERAGLLDAHGR
jgi:hypothetical protein